MTYADKYRFLFGYGGWGEFLTGAGKFTRLFTSKGVNLYDALFGAYGSLLYVFDEFDNLIGVIPDAKPVCKEIVREIVEGFNLSYTLNVESNTHTAGLFRLINYLRQNYRYGYDNALEHAARVLVETARKLALENAV